MSAIISEDDDFDLVGFDLKVPKFVIFVQRQYMYIVGMKCKFHQIVEWKKDVVDENEDVIKFRGKRQVSKGPESIFYAEER